MITKLSRTFLLLVIIFPVNIFAQPDNTSNAYPDYSINLFIQPELKFIKVNGSLVIPGSYRTDTLVFYLHKQLDIHSFALNEHPGYKIHSDSSDIRYMPDARKIFLIPAEEDLSGDFITISFEYSGSITDQPEWLANSISGEWVEMGKYYPWFPFSPVLEMFTYNIDIIIDSSYTVFTAGNQSGVNEFSNLYPTNDIVVCAAKDLKIKSNRIQGTQFRLVYYSLDDVTIDSLLSDVKDIYTFFNQVFGERTEETVLVESKREKGGAYSRPGGIYLTGFTSAAYLDYRTGYKKYLAHEISHNWWHLADSNTWHDWLNESFAEFSAFLFLRYNKGIDEFNKRIKKCKEESEGTPPLWELDRNHEQAYTVLYQKGPVILENLYIKTGEEEFIKLLQEVLRTKKTNTAGFLKIIENVSGKETAVWFESMLKSF